MSMRQTFMTGPPMNHFSLRAQRIFAASSRTLCRTWISTVVLMVAVCCVCSLHISKVRADEPVRVVFWSELSPDQQSLLKKYEKSWSQLLPNRQAALAEASLRWHMLDPTSRQTAGERFDQWRALSSSQREAMRAHLEQLKMLSADRQEQVRVHAAQFKARPVSDQQLLLKRWQEMAPAQ